MGRRTYKILAALLLLAGGSTYLWVRQEDRSNRPAPSQAASVGSGQSSDASGIAEQPGGLAHHWEATRASGDVDAIVLAFKQANDCLLYHAAVNGMRSMLEDERRGDLSNETVETLRMMDAESARYAFVVERLEGFCKGSDKRQLARGLSNALFEAAVRGNPDAQTCFLLMGPTPWLGSRLITEEAAEIERHIRHTSGFTQQALQRADPRVSVQALHRYVNTPNGHASWTDTVPMPDPVLTWRGARLAALRALPDQRADVESLLALFVKTGALSPADIQSADRWAQDTFERQFRGEGAINLYSAVPCYSSPELAP